MVEYNCGLEPETAGTATERVAVARQRTVDESGITDCVSSLFVLLSCSLCCSLSVQFVACCCVISVVAAGLLLFYSFCCSPLFCVLDLFCAAVRTVLV